MRRRVGYALMVVGVLTILVAVFFVLEHANGPGTGPKTFASRRSYDMVKASVHQTFPRAFAAGLVGLIMTMLGKHLLRSKPE